MPWVIALRCSRVAVSMRFRQGRLTSTALECCTRSALKAIEPIALPQGRIDKFLHFPRNLTPDFL